jgi:RNA polymerase sigma-70 factor (ECF subfamily)
MSGTDAEAQPLGAFLPPVAFQVSDFSSIYDEWFAEVARWVRALGGPEADLEDLTQDVFVVVQRTLPGFDGRNLPGWLYRITRRAVRDHRRKAWFRNLFLRPREVALEELAEAGPSPAELYERREAERRLFQLLEGMSEKRRSTFVLFEIEGYSGEEIAALENVPVATVWTRLHHARKELAARVAALADGGRAAPGRAEGRA